MSVQASTWAIEQECATATEKAVLLVIASYAGPDGSCYPGQETIARQACCSVKTVERSLAAFEERGWITRQHRQRRDGSRTSDLIHLPLAPNPESLESQTDTESVRKNPTRHPVQSNPTPCPIQPDTVSGLTTFEPLGEPLGEPSDAQPARKAEVVEAIWQLQPVVGGKRKSTRSDVEHALVAAKKRGGKPGEIIRALTAYYALPDCRKDGGRYARGAEVMLNRDRWRDFLPSEKPDNCPGPADPRVQASRLRRYRDTGVWEPGWGPMPDTANDDHRPRDAA